MNNLCANWNNQNKQVHVVKWKKKIELTNTKIYVNLLNFTIHYYVKDKMKGEIKEHMS
jgi:hypothetical protein